MTTGEDFIRAVYADETASVWLVLLTIQHPSFIVDVRVVNNKVDIESRGETYAACAFEPVWTSDEAGSPPQAQLRIDNISQELVKEIRSVDDSLVVIIEVVLADNPDLVEHSLEGYTLKNVKADIHTITGTLSLDDLRGESFPADNFTPANFPGMF